MPMEVDLELVRHTRRAGVLGLGQPLKSFRDTKVEFPVYDRTTFDNTYLDSLGSLTKRRRAGDEEAPTLTAAPAPPPAGTASWPNAADHRVRST
jgi:hypothetical protein